MITYLHLENFKSFSDITLDLRKSQGEAKNLAFIYGENGSGKSNLVCALSMLKDSIATLRMEDILRQAFERRGEAEDKGLSAKDKEKFDTCVIEQFTPPLYYLLKEHRRIACDAPMVIELGFRLEGRDGSYRMVFDEEEIIEEELRYLIEKKEGIVYKIVRGEPYFSPTIFFDTEYKNELKDLIERYWGKHTFLGILAAEISRLAIDYINARVANNILIVYFWLEKLSVRCTNFRGSRKQHSEYFPFNLPLDQGKVKSEDNRELKLVGELLDEFLTQVYSDIKSVRYRLTPDNGDYDYELILTKQIDDELIDIPVSKESTGTRKLLEIFPLLMMASIGETVVIDEIDSGIHDLLMLEVLEPLMESIKGQLILTTHNTLLLEEMDPENAYIIAMDAKGNKDIACVRDYAKRTQKAHNMQRKYLRGDYGGIPYIGAFDYEDLWDLLRPDEEAIE